MTPISTAMNSAQPAPRPIPSMEEEWDNPAMTEFKRQEALDRIEFAQSRTQEEWREALKQPILTDQTITLVRRPPYFPFKLIKLPW